MRLAATAFALTLAFAIAPTASAHSVSAGAGDFASPARAGSTGSGSSLSPCSDGKYNFQGTSSHWQQPLRWSFRASSVPAAYSASTVLSIIKRAFNNITGARNDCGRADNVSATSSYLGTTSRKPNVTSSGGCGTPDGHNVVGFAPLDGFYSGYTCIWWIGDEILEADMRLDTDTAWALTASSCANELMMEALVTHEAGHAFGLAHVGENNHGRLTMSTYIDGLCENQESTLGLGDLRGLEALY
jgi:hypothetical protein